MINRPPTYLHDGETLVDTLSARDPVKVDRGRTSGNVALMKSAGNEVEY